MKEHHINCESKEQELPEIHVIKGADRVRLRPAVAFGSDGKEGCLRAVREIVINAAIEAKEGFGSEVIIKRFADGSFEVRDFGRGIPVLYDEEQKQYAWEYNFCDIYAQPRGAKLEPFVFHGADGIFLCAVQYASKWMKAVIVRDECKYTLLFKAGQNIGGLTVEDCKDAPTGTTLTFALDDEVFTDTNVSYEMMDAMLEELAELFSGVQFTLEYQPGRTRIYKK